MVHYDVTRHLKELFMTVQVQTIMKVVPKERVSVILHEMKKQTNSSGVAEIDAR